MSSKLAQFDGSVVVERTRGELAARCADERANNLALNLAHEIIIARKSCEEARRFHAETVQQKKHQEYMTDSCSLSRLPIRPIPMYLSRHANRRALTQLG